MKDLAIGIDLGGTNLKGSVMSRDGTTHRLMRVPTEAEKGGTQVLENILGLIGSLVEAEKCRDRVLGVGIGTPGFIDSDGTIIGGAENIPGWKGTSVYGSIGERTGFAVTGANDVTVTALAESRYGAGKGIANMALLALGTGIGGGVVINGHVYKGTHGMAAELGHITVVTDGRQCNCGKKGCVEQYASGPGVARTARELCGRAGRDERTAFVQEVLAHPDQVSAKTVYEYVETGDPMALRVHEYTAEMLARAVGAVLNAFAPDLIVLGGGVMKRNRLLLDDVAAKAPSHCWKDIAERSAFAMAECGEDAGVKGAAALVFDELSAA